MWMSEKAFAENIKIFRSFRISFVAKVSIMLVSIKDLMNELKVTVASSKKSETIRNVKETIKEASDIYRTTVAEAV